jgi:hypothetical protein
LEKGNREFSLGHSEVEPHRHEPVAPAVARNPPKLQSSSANASDFAKAPPDRSEDAHIPPRSGDRGFPRRRVKEDHTCVKNIMKDLSVNENSIWLPTRHIASALCLGQGLSRKSSLILPQSFSMGYLRVALASETCGILDVGAKRRYAPMVPNSSGSVKSTSPSNSMALPIRFEDTITAILG